MQLFINSFLASAIKQCVIYIDRAVGSWQQCPSVEITYPIMPCEELITIIYMKTRSICIAILLLMTSKVKYDNILY